MDHLSSERMNQKEIDRAEWANPRNWQGGPLGLYGSIRDSRLIVPKRNQWMGWTLNTGKPLGKAVTVAALGIVAVVVMGELAGWW